MIYQPARPSKNPIIHSSNNPIRLSFFGCVLRLARNGFFRYLTIMNWLTKQEQWVLCIVIGLLATGLLVKFYRAAHPPAEVGQSAKP